MFLLQKKDIFVSFCLSIPHLRQFETTLYTDSFLPNNNKSGLKGLIVQICSSMPLSSKKQINTTLGFVDYQKAFDPFEVWAVFRAPYGTRKYSRYSKLIRDIYEEASFRLHIDEHHSTDKIPIEVFDREIQCLRSYLT